MSGTAARITVTGATGLLGPRLVKALQERGAAVTALARDPARARRLLPGVTALEWSLSEPAPVEALSGADAVVHLAGEPVSQRWTASAKRAIHDSRALGTQALVAGIEQAPERPPVLVSASACGYYGPRGEEPIDEDAPPGRDFLASVCVAWEAAAARATQLGTRVVVLRTGIVLDPTGGALARMLTPFRLGAGGPVAGGRQYMPWLHPADHAGLVMAAIEDDSWSGPINAAAPAPVTNAEFARTLGRVLRRPARLPLPRAALSLVFGEMAQIIATGVRAVPAKALVLGYDFRHTALEGALRDVLA